MKKLNNLIPCSQFVLEQMDDDPNAIDYYRVIKYASFLQQPLSLGMFIPVSEDGEVLGDLIKPEDNSEIGCDKYYQEQAKYQKALSNVMFKGFLAQTEPKWMEYYGGIRVFNPTSDTNKMVSYVFRETDLPKTVEHFLRYSAPVHLTQSANDKIFG